MIFLLPLLDELQLVLYATMSARHTDGFVGLRRRFHAVQNNTLASINQRSRLGIFKLKTHGEPNTKLEQPRGF